MQETDTIMISTPPPRGPFSPVSEQLGSVDRVGLSGTTTLGKGDVTQSIKGKEVMCEGSPLSLLSFDKVTTRKRIRSDEESHN